VGWKIGRLLRPPISELLDDNISPDQAIALQERWQAWATSHSCNETSTLPTPLHDLNRICRIAGVDVSYPKGETPSWGIACAVLWDVQEGIEITHHNIRGAVRFPYIPGLLGFREAKLMAQALHLLPKIPDLIMCDGHGIAHPRRFGEAVHVGVALDIPSVGVAKAPFYGVGNWKKLPRTRGARTGIYEPAPETPQPEKGALLGQAVCLVDGRKPVFVSAGYRTTLDIAIAITLQSSTTHRQTEPLFLADRYSREAVKFSKV
jgi:deoxyribonuclease V